MRSRATPARGPECAVFKQCSVCGHTWATRDDFLNDPGLELIGYQVNFKILEAGLFLFNHNCKGATLAIPAAGFQDLYAGPVFRTRATGGPQCPEHCLHTNDLRPCPAQCECAYIREVLQMIRKDRKQPNPLRS